MPLASPLDKLCLNFAQYWTYGVLDNFICKKIRKDTPTLKIFISKSVLSTCIFYKNCDMIINCQVFKHAFVQCWNYKLEVSLD